MTLKIATPKTANQKIAPTKIAYCTNVHPGNDWQTVQQNTQRYSAVIASNLRSGNRWPEHQPLGIGLWLSHDAIVEANSDSNIDRYWESIQRMNAQIFTLNSFPYGNFHQTVVKHRVYCPTWWDESRLQYTLANIDFLAAALLTQSAETRSHQSIAVGEIDGSISTLPIAWGKPRPSEEELQQAAKNLLHVVDYLHETYTRTGKRIVLAIEPEPGCLFTDHASLRAYFADYLFRTSVDERRTREYMTICHDVCHSAVMFEDQAEELDRDRAAGIRIGKVQVSSAIEIDWARHDVRDRERVVDRLSTFAEDRYLHQTCMARKDGTVSFFEDLPDAIDWIRNADRLRDLTDEVWRIHFHVPIFYDGLDSHDDLDSHRDRLAEIVAFSTTQSQISECLRALQHLQTLDPHFFSGHYEVETYAWSVLPQELQHDSLSEDVTRELVYFASLLQSQNANTRV